MGSYKCVCKSGFNGNGIVCSEPAAFQSHPSSQSVSLDTEVQLLCSFYNSSPVSFSWIKDGKLLNEASLQNLTSSSTQSNGVGIYTGGSLVNHVMTFTFNSPVNQGYYWCRVQDSSNNIVESFKALVRLKDSSTSRISLTVQQTFSPLLLDKTTSYYKDFETKVKQSINSMLENKVLSPANVIVLENVRSGSVLVDAVIYYTNVNSTIRSNICNGVHVVTAQDFSTTSTSNLNISHVNTTSYDCCPPSTTGQAEYKGIINWPSTLIDTVSSVDCPYNYNVTVNNRANRRCSGDGLSGPSWGYSDTTRCQYRSKTTQSLYQLSQENYTSNTVVEASQELDTLTSNPDKLSTDLDIKFAVETVDKIIVVNGTLDLVADNVLNVTSNLMAADDEIVIESQQKYQTSEKLLNAVQKMADDIPLAKNTTTVIKVKKNIALGIAELGYQSLQGLLIQGKTVQNSFNSIQMESSTIAKIETNDIATIFLPLSLIRRTGSANSSTSRVTAFLYDNSKLFLSKTNLTAIRKVLNSKVLSASVKERRFVNLGPNEEMQAFFYPLNESQIGNTSCVYWNTSSSDWLSNGCRYVGDVSGYRNCRCNHLTNFAILLNVGGSSPITPTAKLGLSIITYIGCGVSLAALITTIFIHILFRKQLLAKIPPRILMCLCVSLIGCLVAFLAGTQVKKKAGCQATSVLVHYFVLASFFWMAAEAFNLYKSFVKVFRTSRSYYLRKMILFAWGSPLFIVAVTAGATKLEHYSTQKDNEWTCMIRGIPFYITYLAPIIIIIIGNFIAMILCFRKIFAHSSVSKDHQMSIVQKLRIATACTVLMGVTWIFGVFAVGELTLTFQILFTVFNSLQGFFIFLFYCVGNSDLRMELRKCCCPGSQALQTTSQKTTHSTGLAKPKSPMVRKAKKVESPKAINTGPSPSSHSKTVSDSAKEGTITHSKALFVPVHEDIDVAQGIELNSVDFELPPSAELDESIELVTEADIHTKAKTGQIEADNQNEAMVHKSDAGEIFHIGIENRGMVDNESEATSMNELDEGCGPGEVDALEIGIENQIVEDDDTEVDNRSEAENEVDINEIEADEIDFVTSDSKRSGENEEKQNLSASVSGEIEDVVDNEGKSEEEAGEATSRLGDKEDSSTTSQQCPGNDPATEDSKKRISGPKGYIYRGSWSFQQ